MTMLTSKFKTIGRAAVVALALGASALAIVPAQAQQGPAFNFNLQIPGGTSYDDQGNYTGNGQDAHVVPRRHGGGNNNNGGYDNNYDNGGYGRCLTNREVRREIESNGYEEVEIQRQLPRDRVEVVGQYGNWLYSMRVDKCTGEVDRVERLRRVQGGGFGLQFNFGN